MQNNSWQTILYQIELCRSDFNEITENMSSYLALFGAGPFGISVLRYLQKIGYAVDCFIDNDPCKQGMKIEQIPVCTLDQLPSNAVKTILITAKHAIPQVKRQLGKKYLNMSFDTWFVIKNIDKYENIRNNILGDNHSKGCLDGILLAMLTGDEKYCASIMDSNQYFCLPRFLNTGTEYFVDAGAYVGDTLEKFIWAHNGAFKHIYTFEPGTKQFEALSQRKQRLVVEWALDPDSISLIRGGLADKNGEAEINLREGAHLLSTSLIVAEKTNPLSNIKLFSLDDFIKDKPVTFIKADIEGMETAMLKGAEKTIKRNKPKMALSTYHEPADLFEIIEMIRNFVPAYRIELRHHSPLLMDTILYCWVEE